MSEPAPALRVLVVDDHADTAESLAMLLALWGHEALTARDGAAALMMASAFGPDVALLDLGLPGMDGYELARRLRQLPGLAGVALVALTGYAGDDYWRRSRQEGFAFHLVKPMFPEELQTILGGLAREKARRSRPGPDGDGRSARPRPPAAGPSLDLARPARRGRLSASAAQRDGAAGRAFSHLPGDCGPVEDPSSAV
jgi:CheY-like chemotaxis protein